MLISVKVISCTPCTDKNSKLPNGNYSYVLGATMSVEDAFGTTNERKFYLFGKNQLAKDFETKIETNNYDFIPKVFTFEEPNEHGEIVKYERTLTTLKPKGSQ